MNHPEPDARILRGGFSLAEAQRALAYPAARWTDHLAEAVARAAVALGRAG